MILNKLTYFVFVFYFVFSASVLGLCPIGYFKISSMKFCYPWLKCNEIRELSKNELIGFGSTKNVYLASWKNNNVSYISLRNRQYQYDFYHGLYILKTLPPNKYIIQLIGFCEITNTIITEYHENNNALNYYFLRKALHLEQKFNICINYVQIIDYLHDSPIGTRVNCDSNDLEKLLSQLLITKDLTIILADVDALPHLVENSTIMCGKKEIKSTLAAPEQMWTKSKPFHTKYMNGYDEKIDIWKIPDVCNYFLSGPDYELIQYSLFTLHQKCKNPDPQNRPSTKYLARMYEEIRDFYLEEIYQYINIS